MMPHTTRGRAFAGILAMLALALVASALTGPEPAPAGTPPREAGGDLLGTVIRVSAGLVAATVAATVLWLGIRAALPHTRRCVRTVRAWQIRRRARAVESYAPAPTSGRSKTLARVFVGVLVASVGGVALCAVLLNYAHGRDVAMWNGETGWRAWLYPLPADGLLISASMVTVWQLLESGRASWRPRIAFAFGVMLSTGANVLDALHSGVAGAELIERILWTASPTAVLLFAHEMLLLMLARYARQADLFGTQGPNPLVVAAEQARDDAKARAQAAEQRANDLVRQAQEDAQRLQEQARAEADRELGQQAEELAQVRTQLDSERATWKQERQKLTAQHEATRRDFEQVRAQLDELARADDEADEGHRDFERVAAAAERWVAEERRARPYESLVADVVSVFRVSPRWVQNRVPAARQQRSEHDRSAVAQLAFAG